MSIYSDTMGGILFLRPNQDADFETAKGIRERLDIAANDDIVFVILDFSLATLVSTATLRVILDAAQHIHQRRGCIAIAGASEQFHALLVISDVLKLVPAFPSIKQAQNHLLTFVKENDAFFSADDSEI
jgi:anti-anti-sigma factor